MTLSLFGLTIGGGVAFALILIGLLALSKWGSSVKGILGMIPIGNPKLWAIILIGVGLFAGGFTYFTGLLPDATASIITSKETISNAGPVQMTCKINTISGTTGTVGGNSTFTADNSDSRHYTVYLKNATGSGAGSFNGTLTCTREGDIEQSAKATCYISGGSYLNQNSLSDDTTYYLLSRTDAKSEVPGQTYRQVAYLNDGSIATTSSNQEKASIVFTGGSSAQAQETIGFYFTLSGDTNLNYLKSSTDGGRTVDVDIICDGVNQGKITFAKVTA